MGGRLRMRNTVPREEEVGVVAGPKGHWLFRFKVRVLGGLLPPALGAGTQRRACQNQFPIPERGATEEVAHLGLLLARPVAVAV